jgi:hypothetical protein
MLRRSVFFFSSLALVVCALLPGLVVRGQEEDVFSSVALLEIRVGQTVMISISPNELGRDLSVLDLSTGLARMGELDLLVYALAHYQVAVEVRPLDEGIPPEAILARVAQIRGVHDTRIRDEYTPLATSPVWLWSGPINIPGGTFARVELVLDVEHAALLPGVHRFELTFTVVENG